MPKLDTQYLQQRNGWWHFAKRIPNTRKYVRRKLGTKELKEAQTRRDSLLLELFGMSKNIIKLKDKKIPFKFGTKAETLEILRPRLKSAKILEQYYFTVEDWRRDKESVIAAIEQKGWIDKKLIIRSSALSEDIEKQSMAGHFVSCKGVFGKNSIVKGVKKVISSYDNVGKNQVLTQPQLENISVSGVAFSCDPSSSGPYRIINYDAASGNSETVTSGNTNALNCFYCHKLSPVKPKGFLKRIIATIDELEKLTDCHHLDIEFAVGQNNEIYIFQVRPLVSALANNINIDAHKLAIERIQKKFRTGVKGHPNLYGKRTVYGVMPDWNPAEIIGLRPRQLALSIYRELVTDATWAYQRDNYGYRNLRSFPLLVDFEKLPYIDVRVSFNSFLPKGLPVNLAKKLVDYYIDTLMANPALHDKVEFEIVFSCYSLDLKNRLNKLKKHGFSHKEVDTLASSLTDLTNKVICTGPGLWEKDISKILKLEKRQTQLLNGDLDILSKIYWLIEDCKRYGTLPFAGLARAAFIATQILQSFVRKTIITEKEQEVFLQSIDSISSQIKRDFSRLNKIEFLKKYGHLRPGTYDILSARYDETPERYFDWDTRINSRTSKKNSEFSLSVDQLRKIQKNIDNDGLEIEAHNLLSFIKTAIEAREMAKFVFTRSISECLKLLEEFAKNFGITREECSYIYIKDILGLYSSSGDIEEVLKISVTKGKKYHELSKSIILPPIIANPEEAWLFRVPNTIPNYITQNEALGKSVLLDSEPKELKDAILMISSADPGFDWIFSQGIKGFITKFGGANSHMAVRAAELGIPAVIGAGKLLYDEWSSAKILHIDCVNHQVRIVQ